MPDLKNGFLERIFKNTPHFSNDLIEPFNEEEFETIKRFSAEEYWCGNESINIFNVSGTRHPDYQGKSWLWFLQNGKRMRLNLTLFEQNPGYYLGEARKEPAMSYVRVDGKLYVDHDGNHRTCIARFFYFEKGLTHLRGVEVREYRVDGHAMATFEAIRRALDVKKITHIHMESFREKADREDSAGWMKERFEIGARLRNVRSGGLLVLKRQEFQGFLSAIEGMGGFKRFLGGDKYTKFLSGRGGAN